MRNQTPLAPGGLFGEYDDLVKSAGERLLSRIAAALEGA